MACMNGYLEIKISAIRLFNPCDIFLLEWSGGNLHRYQRASKFTDNAGFPFHVSDVETKTPEVPIRRNDFGLRYKRECLKVEIQK